MCKAIEEMLMEVRRKIALNVIQSGLLSLDVIAECVDLPLAEIEEMARTKGA